MYKRQANTIVQNPEVVGKHNMPSKAVMYCKQIAISVKGWRQFRPRKDFMMYKSNTEIALMCA